jgi:ornithine cyclodeaminase/alanine dehydrogenase-like protein (mu-crystallin family)
MLRASGMTLYLDEGQIRPLLGAEELIPAMRQALIDFSAGRLVQPVRTPVPVRDQNFFLVMPAVVRGAMGVKIVTVYPGNAGTQVPTHLASIFLMRPETGETLAVLDGTLITEMRTAAVSAVATDLLAAPDAHVLAILGSGVQAHVHAEVLPLVRRFDEVRVWSRTPEHAASFAAEIGARSLPLEQAVRDADVVVTCTTSDRPFLQGSWLKAGAHVNAVGSPRPNWRELHDDVLLDNVLYVDSREGASKESGDVIGSGAPIYAEIGEALAGTKEARRAATTVFKSLGMAIEDITAAKLVYDRAIG